MVTVIDNSGSSPDRTAIVEIYVQNAQGGPASGVRTELRDASGAHSRIGQTDRDGRIRFLEGVGGGPCNNLFVMLPGMSNQEFITCADGDEEVTRGFAMSSSGEVIEIEPPDSITSTLIVAGAGSVIGGAGAFVAKRRGLF